MVKNFHRFGLGACFGGLSASEALRVARPHGRRDLQARVRPILELKRLGSSVFYDITSIYFRGAAYESNIRRKLKTAGCDFCGVEMICMRSAIRFTSLWIP